MSVKADESETWLMLSCCSKHWRTGGHEYNEDNHGVAIQHIFRNRDYLIVGAYRNSFYLQSNYAGYGFRTWELRGNGLRLESSVLVGGVSGYGDDLGEANKHSLMVIPILTLRGKNAGLMVMGVPGLLLGLGLEVRLP